MLSSFTFPRCFPPSANSGETDMIMKRSTILIAISAAATTMDVGYAKFDLGVNITLGKTIWPPSTQKNTNDKTTCFFGENMAMWVLPSHDLQNVYKCSLMFGNETLQQFDKKYVDDPVGWYTCVEETRPPVFRKMIFMTGSEFLLYKHKVYCKTGFICAADFGRYGENEVFAFSSPTTKGIVKIGTDPENRSHALVVISSLDGKKAAQCQLSMTGNSMDVSPLLSRLIGSFQFVETPK